MTYKEEYAQLDARQLQLRVDIANSDAHALKCIKRGLVFEEEYPEEYATYDASVQEYNQNETRMEELVTLIADEEAAEAEAKEVEE